MMALKKTALLLTVLIGLSTVVTAQKRHYSNGYELGIRLGDTHGSSASIDAMIPFGGSRIHADASFWDNGVTLAALYNWQFPIGNNFWFYPGAGGVINTFGEFNLGVAGEVGAEYKFDIPLTIGIDWRPVIGLINSNGFHGDGFGLNVRYRF
ncbi:MAG: hypothetical protein PHQ65_03990 [Bacteroidales bacterium]|nr:hypothetical protein [Bacteroidales bacterium]MDD3664401.1 hypothetical protein [Bacteroidales bacterium]